MSIRPSAFAGTWYPRDPIILAEQVDTFLAGAEVAVPDGRVWGVVAPHAGYRYSGRVAGHAFRCLSGLCPELVVVISPMHHALSPGLLTSAHEAYATPLGPVAVDRAGIEALSARLEARLGFGLYPLRRDPEHSLEIELPFLLRALGGPFRLLPVMIRDQSQAVAEALGQALASLLDDRDVLFVASTDLSHFYPQSLARELDAEFLRRVVAFDPLAILAAEEVGAAYACGRGAVAAMLWAAAGLGANRATILHYGTSGDVTGDDRRVVGYGAAVIWQAEG